MLSAGTGLSLLDDPTWAFQTAAMGLAYRQRPAWRDGLERHDVVKCPRMAEVLPEVLADFPCLQIVLVLRDPRDVYSSILEKTRTGRPTRMLDYRRLGTDDEGWLGICIAFNHYVDTLLAASAIVPAEQLAVIDYERFFAERVGVVQEVAERFGLAFSPEPARRISARQLSPARNKADDDQSIKGPARWRRDLPADVADAMGAMSLEPLERARQLLSPTPLTGERS